MKPFKMVEVDEVKREMAQLYQHEKSSRSFCLVTDRTTDALDALWARLDLELIARESPHYPFRSGSEQDDIQLFVWPLIKETMGWSAANFHGNDELGVLFRGQEVDDFEAEDIQVALESKYGLKMYQLDWEAWQRRPLVDLVAYLALERQDMPRRENRTHGSRL